MNQYIPFRLSQLEFCLSLTTQSTVIETRSLIRSCYITLAIPNQPILPVKAIFFPTSCAYPQVLRSPSAFLLFKLSQNKKGHPKETNHPSNHVSVWNQNIKSDLGAPRFPWDHYLLKMSNRAVILLSIVKINLPEPLWHAIKWSIISSKQFELDLFE